jgi:transcription antitermination factor NusG
MFRNYLFVGDTENGKRDLIPNLPCVMKVLKCTDDSGRWATLSDRLVLAIFQQEMTERFAMPVEPNKRRVFRPGDMVRIIEGQFAGFDGRFDRLAGKDRISILFWLLGREVRTTIHADQVAVA